MIDRHAVYYVICNKMCVSHSVVPTISLNSPTNLPPLLFSNVHGVESDFWSLGVLAFELLFGQRPFEKHCPSLHITYLEESLKRTAARSVIRRDSIHVSIKCRLLSDRIALHRIALHDYYCRFNLQNTQLLQLSSPNPTHPPSYPPVACLHTLIKANLNLI